MFDRPLQFALYRLMLAAILTALVFAVALALGLPALKIAMFAAALCLALFSMLAVKQIAQQGAKLDAKRQLVILLSVEFLFVPLAMTAATVGYFLK